MSIVAEVERDVMFKSIAREYKGAELQAKDWRKKSKWEWRNLKKSKSSSTVKVSKSKQDE